MVEYRRDIESRRKNDRWHWHPDCKSYPTRSFAIRKDVPSDEDLCADCAEAMNRRSADLRLE